MWVKDSAWPSGLFSKYKRVCVVHHKKALLTPASTLFNLYTTGLWWGVHLKKDSVVSQPSPSQNKQHSPPSHP